MTKKNKRSVRTQRPSYNPLNDTEEVTPVDDKREGTPVEELMNPNTDSPIKEETRENGVVSESEEVTVEQLDDHDTDLTMDIPDYDLKPAPTETDLSFPPTMRYRKNHPTTSVTQTIASPKSMFSLSNPIMKYGLIALVAVALLVGVFVGTRKPKSTGPTVIDVTETDNGEKKSVRNSVNRVSSPRIVFGDLRKNPSLMVAPPMTPGKH